MNSYEELDVQSIQAFIDRIKVFAQYGLNYDDLSRTIQEALSPYCDITVTNDSIPISQEDIDELL